MTSREVNTQCGVNPSNITDEALGSIVPLCLRGFGAAWPVVQQAGKDFKAGLRHLAQIYSGAPLRACYLDAGENGRIFYNANLTGFNYTEQTRSFLDIAGELLDPSFHQQKTVYISSTEVARCFPELRTECEVHHRASEGLVNIWIGGPSRIAAHYDAAQNLACCLVGRRRFTLFPPEQVANLYPGPLGFAPGGREISLVDFHAPNLAQFPQFEQALENAFEVELHPGDALIIPSMWWHHVEGLDTVNALLTHWWKDSPAFLGRPTSALLHTLMAIRDLPKEQRAAWKALFDYYIFNADESTFQHIPDHAKKYLKQPLSEELARQLRAELQNQLRR